MSAKTKIQWADSSANCVIGCTKVSAGCASCYAANDTPARVLRHRGIETWGDKGQRVPVKGFEKSMLAMNRKPWICNKCGVASHEKICWGKCTSNKPIPITFHRRRIFCDSNSDWLDDKWPIETLAHFLDVQRRCPDVTLINCTKRPENFFPRMRAMMTSIRGYEIKTPLLNWLEAWTNGQPPTNIVMLTSVENQPMADRRIPELLKIPEVCRGLSVEPLIGPVSLRWLAVFDGMATKKTTNTNEYDGLRKLDWLIIGCESGPRRRECKLEWIESLVEQGNAAGVAVFVKQISLNGKVSHDPADWPEHLRVREWPAGF
jgi:protein gp37